MARLVHVKILSCPHLMLANFRGNNNVICAFVYEARQQLHGALWHNSAGFGIVFRLVKRIVLPKRRKLRKPFLRIGTQRVLGEHVVQRIKHKRQIANNRYRRFPIFANLSWIDVNVYHISMRRKRLKLARYTIGKTRAARNNKIGVVQCIIGVARTMHSHKTEVQRLICGKYSLRHKRCYGRNIRLAHQLQKLL